MYILSYSIAVRVLNFTSLYKILEENLKFENRTVINILQNKNSLFIWAVTN